MGTSGTRGSSIPSRNVWCATVVQSTPRIPFASILIDAVTDIVDSSDQACDHGLSSLRPDCSAPTIGRPRWPSPVYPIIFRCGAGHGTVTAAAASRARVVPFATVRMCTPSSVRTCLRLVNACTRPHPSSHLPLTCERSPLSRDRAQGEFASIDFPLIVRNGSDQRRRAKMSPLGDRSTASRTKITAHPTS